MSFSSVSFKDTGSHVGSVCCLLASVSAKLPGDEQTAVLLLAAWQEGADRGTDKLQAALLHKGSSKNRDGTGKCLI